MFPKLPDNNAFIENGSDFVYEFGPFSLNVAEHTLKRSGEKLELRPKTAELLAFLIQKNGKIATKSEIFETVWKDSFVEEANLAVHISSLRKIFAADKEPIVKIETVPRVGYRFEVDGEIRRFGVSDSVVEQSRQPISSVEDASVSTKQFPVQSRKKPLWPIFVGGLITGVLATSVFVYWEVGTLVRASTGYDYIKIKKYQTFKTEHCPRDASPLILAIAGCEEAVSAFTLASNPNGNWSYGYSLKGDLSNFVLFQKAEHNNHFGSPEEPVDMWRRPEEWHPLILRNTSPYTIVIQDGLVVPPNMFEMHPGANGERSVLRWTAPADGHFRAQGQFRGLNLNGDTTTDALVVHNTNEIRFSADIEGYNIEKPFDLTFKAAAGDTIDFSVGYGKNQAYECDSTGVSVLITTISLANGSETAQN